MYNDEVVAFLDLRPESVRRGGKSVQQRAATATAAVTLMNNPKETAYD